MTLHSLPIALGAVANMALAFLVYAREKTQPVNRAFALFTLAVAVWNIHELGLQFAPSERFALYWGRGFGIGLMLIPPFFLHFALLLVEKHHGVRKTLLHCFYGLGTIFVVLLWAGRIVTGYTFISYQYFPDLTVVYQLYALNLILVFVWAFVEMGASYRGAERYAQKRLQFVFLASVSGFLLGSTNLLLSYGVRMYPVGHLGGVAFSGIAAYGILKYDARS